MTTVAPASNAVSWQQIDSTGRLLRAQYKADFGDPFCLMVKTGDNSWLAYSPGPSLLAAAQTLISSDAELILVAPSVGHSMGLTPWLEAFPQAKLTASRRTASHLGKKLQLTKFIPVAECQQGLPDWLQILELPDNFFGECWLRIDGDSSSSDANTRYWAACDSLMNLEKLSGKRLMDWLLKLYGLNTGLHFHARFRRSCGVSLVVCQSVKSVSSQSVSQPCFFAAALSATFCRAMRSASPLLFPPLPPGFPATRRTAPWPSRRALAARRLAR